VVTFDPETNRNTYTDATGKVLDPATFDPQGLGNEGPRLPGAEYDAFTPSARPGLTITDMPFAVSDGSGGVATNQSLSFRQTAAPGGGSAPGGGAAPGGGGGFQFDAQRDQTMSDLRGGRQQMEQQFAQTQQTVNDLTNSYGQLQRAYQDAVRTGAPNASYLGDQLRAQETALREAETELDKQKTSLAFQPREGTYRQAAGRITQNQQRRQEIRAAGGYPDQINIRNEMLKSLPQPDGTVETEVQRRRILSGIARFDQQQQELAVSEANAQANLRNAETGGRDIEARELDRARTLQTLNEIDRVSVTSETVGPAGESIGGQIRVKGQGNQPTLTVTNTPAAQDAFAELTAIGVDPYEALQRLIMEGIALTTAPAQEK
jgi:hypothetical protein